MIESRLHVLEAGSRGEITGSDTHHKIVRDLIVNLIKDQKCRKQFENYYGNGHPNIQAYVDASEMTRNDKNAVWPQTLRLLLWRHC